MHIYFSKKIIRKLLSLYSVLSCAFLRTAKELDERSVTRQVMVSRGRSSFCCFSLGQVLRAPAVPNRSSPLPSGGKNALWISLSTRDPPPKPAPRHLHRACGLGPRLTPFLASPVLPSLQSHTEIPPLFCRIKAPFYARKSGDKQTLCFEGSNSASRNEKCLQCFSDSQELQDPGSPLSTSPKSAGTSEAPDAQG